MKDQTYLSKYLPVFEELGMINELVLADIATPVGDGEEIVGKMDMFHKRLLSLIKIKVKEVALGNDVDNELEIRFLFDLLFLLLECRFGKVEGTDLVVRQGHRVCRKDRSANSEMRVFMFAFAADDSFDNRPPDSDEMLFFEQFQN